MDDHSFDAILNVVCSIFLRRNILLGESTTMFDVFTNPRERLEVLLESYIRDKVTMNVVAIVLEGILNRLPEFKINEAHILRDYSRYLDCCISNELASGNKYINALTMLGRFLKLLPSCNEKRLKEMSIFLLKLLQTNDCNLLLNSASTTAAIFSDEYIQCPRCDEVWIACEDESPIICPKCLLPMHNPYYRRLKI